MFNVFSVVKVVAYLGIVIIIAGGLWYAMNLKAELATSEANNKILENSISEQSQVIEQMRVDIAQIQRINEEVKNLVNRFNVNAKGESRDIGKIASKKPRAMQRLINRGTVNALRCLEIATGAERTEKEINAKKESEINRECPTLANPNYIPVFN